MKVKSVVEFHKQAPRNATHVLMLGDKYEYANFTGRVYDSCDNSDFDEGIKNPTAPTDNWFFNIGNGDWEVYLELCKVR